MALDHSFHRLASELPEWDDVARVGGVYSTAAWAAIYEPTFVAVRDGGRVVAVAPCFLGTAPGQLPAFSEPDYLFSWDGNPAAVDIPIADVYPFVFVGAVRGYTSRLLIDEAVAASARPAVIAALLTAVRDHARANGARLVSYGYLPAAELEELRGVDAGIAAVFHEADCMIGPVSSYEDYEASLKQFSRSAKNSRLRSVKRELKRGAAAGFTFEWRRYREVVEDVARIFHEHDLKFDPTLTMEQTRAIAHSMLKPGVEERTRALCMMQGDRMVGIEAMMVHDATYSMRVGGCTRDAPAEALPYFHAVFYGPIRAALDAGARYIHYGAGALDAKVFRGCRARTLWTALDPLVEWSPELRTRLGDAAKLRFDKVLPVVQRYYPDPVVCEDLGYRGELAWAVGL